MNANITTRLPTLLGRLPTRWQWTLHNLMAHPLSEILFQLGLTRLSEAVHDCTIPEVSDARAH